MFYWEKLRELEQRLARLEAQLKGVREDLDAQNAAERRFQEGLSNLMSYQGPGEE